MIVSDEVNVAKARAERIPTCTTSETLQACSRCCQRTRPRRRGRSFVPFLGAAAAGAAFWPSTESPPAPLIDDDGNDEGTGSVAGDGAHSTSSPVPGLASGSGEPFPPGRSPYPTTGGAASIVAERSGLPIDGPDSAASASR